MSQENLEIVLDQYAATDERDFRRAMSHYAEDVEMVVPTAWGPLNVPARMPVGTTISTSSA